MGKMGKITDLNIVGLDPAKHAARLGDAHEMIVAGILTRLGFEVGLICAKGGPYDLWLIAYEKPGGKIKPLRVQVRTVSKGRSIKFIGGTRGGVNRVYIPGVKKYKYSEKDNDLIIGVDPKTLDFYLIPTRFISKWGESKGIGKLQPLKNNWDILLNWNDDFLTELEKRLPP
jgi:hypothetical protein